jgi:hypothetical protein
MYICVQTVLPFADVLVCVCRAKQAGVLLMAHMHFVCVFESLSTYACKQCCPLLMCWCVCPGQSRQACFSRLTCTMSVCLRVYVHTRALCVVLQ